MTVQVTLPTALRNLTQNQSTVEAEGETIAELIDNLETRYPGIKEKLYDESGNKRKFITVLIFAKGGVEKLDGALPDILETVNKSSSNTASTVKKHMILTDSLKIGETLTPTLKVMRIAVEKKLENEIDAIYNPINHG